MGERNKTGVRVDIPEEINQKILEYQAAEKNRHNKKSTKTDVVILLMAYGLEKLEMEKKRLIKEYENYQSGGA